MAHRKAERHFHEVGHLHNLTFFVLSASAVIDQRCCHWGNEFAHAFRTETGNQRISAQLRPLETVPSGR
jgi:hypothetical protein